MKTNRIFSTAILLTVTTTVVIAQQQNIVVSKLKVTDLYVSSGFFIDNSTNGSLQNFKTLAPQSLLLKNDLSTYSQGGANNGNSAFNASLGIQISNKEKTDYRKTPLLRLGIGYYSTSSIATSFYTSKTTTYDTLKSTKSNEVIYLDSVKSKHYIMDYSANQLRLDASLIFRTNAYKRWSAFAGIGVNAGVSINSTTTINYYEIESKSNKTTGEKQYGYYNASVTNRKAERFNNKTNFAFAAYVPVGVDFRIGKKSAFWKHTHLFYELRPSLTITSVPELSAFASSGVQQGIGLRITL